jgi:hypothetical protein
MFALEFPELHCKSEAILDGTDCVAEQMRARIVV